MTNICRIFNYKTYKIYKHLLAQTFIQNCKIIFELKIKVFENTFIFIQVVNFYVIIKTFFLKMFDVQLVFPL